MRQVVQEPKNTSKSQTRTESANTREQILNAAEVLFAQKGFKATTLKDVSLASGENSALVSYYFGGKEGLRHQIFLRQSERTQAILDSCLELNDASPEAVRSLVKTLFAQIRADATYYRLGLWALVDGGEVTKQVADDVWNPVFTSFKNLISSIAPKLSQKEIEARCTLLFGAIHQYANLRWNYLEKINFSGSSDELLKSYEDLVLEKIVEICTT